MKDMMQKLMMMFAGKKMRSRMMTEAISTAMAYLHKTADDEYSCDDAFEVLDVYADMIARGDDPSELMPLVKLHLEICGNCREEFEALLTVIAPALAQ